ncbi:MAG: YeeE/YedE family protein [Xanthomonadales bacterium]|nr:hypothetical protein [Xanthomonadales bacterium]MCC6593896.1 YeeE/YedE family protein [Xanthomonadales bacterium]MCE7932747.1 YeeE/YedE family protein [Xanthomonadales bacterium PRO6]
MKPLVALLCGLIFGAGLTVSGMTDPARVAGFLDLFGAWDPTLAFVMGGALAVAVPGFQWLLRRPRPQLDERFHLPTRQGIDRDLWLGAALFGIGWGLSGFCPGPALAGLASGLWQVWLFVAAMAAGMALRHWQVQR